MSRYFGTNGVRGRFHELTPMLALKLSQAIGIYFKRGKVLVARDCRLTGEALRCSVVAGLTSVGCEVVDLGLVSSPTAEYMTKKLDAKGCIIISASHNPPEWNALKVVDGNGVAVSRERGEEIEKLLESIGVAGWDKIGKITKYETATSEHVEAIKKLVDVKKIKSKGPNIVIDCGNGMASVIAPLLFKELGVEALPLNDSLDGMFPGRGSEPTEDSVGELKAAVKTSGADAGIAWDADGDRVIFVDENGNYVIGDRVYGLSMIWKLSKSKGDVVTTVATSRVVEDIAAKYGAKVRYTAIGAPYMSEDMLRAPAAIGGEEVGGVIWPELSLAKDGFLTAAKLAEALCEKPLSAWLNDVPLYYNVKERIKANAEEKKKMMKKVQDHAKKNKLNYIDVDGIRVNMKDSWVIVRPSGTEEAVRVFAEAKTRKDAEKLVEEYKAILTR